MNKLLAIVLPVTLLVGGVAATGSSAVEAPQAIATRTAPEVVAMKDARLKFEINATDQDGGVQLFLDADQWKRMSVFDPSGRRILTSVTKGGMALQGANELFLESAEPNFEELSLEQLLQRWPAGRYAVRGVGLDGQRLVGSILLTHDLPAGPVLISPIKGDGAQDPAATVLRWRGVPPANGSPIVGYQVLVVGPDTGNKAFPHVTLDVTMPPTARRLRVPAGFLRPGTTYEWEVLAIEAGGNQTLAASTLRTSG